MKRKYKILLIISSILLIYGAMLTTDIIRTKNTKTPIFTYELESDDSNSKVYIGLFYTVVYTYGSSIVIPEEPEISYEQPDYCELNFWFFDFSISSEL